MATGRYRIKGRLLDQEIQPESEKEWVADVACLRVPEEFVYVDRVLDPYSRMGVGWNLVPGALDDVVRGAERISKRPSARPPFPHRTHQQELAAQAVRGLQGAL